MRSIVRFTTLTFANPRSKWHWAGLNLCERLTETWIKPVVRVAYRCSHFTKGAGKTNPKRRLEWALLGMTYDRPFTFRCVETKLQLRFNTEQLLINVLEWSEACVKLGLAGLAMSLNLRPNVIKPGFDRTSMSDKPELGWNEKRYLARGLSRPKRFYKLNSI